MRKRRELFIDLTSLLDVILILLFLTICTMNSQASEDQKQAESLQAQNSILAAKNDSYSSENESLSSINTELLNKLDVLQNQADNYSELKDLSEEQISQLAALLDDTLILDLTCENDSYGCHISMGISGKETQEFTIASGDYYTPQPRIQELSQQLNTLISQNQNQDSIIMYCLYYNNREIHRYEYQILIEAIQNTMSGSNQIFMISETKIMNSQNTIE